MRDKKHPSHSFSPLYKGFSEDYVRDGLKFVRSLQKTNVFCGLGVWAKETRSL